MAATFPTPSALSCPAQRDGPYLSAPPLDRVKGRRRRPRAARRALDEVVRRCYVDRTRPRTDSTPGNAACRLASRPLPRHTNGMSAVQSLGENVIRLVVWPVAPQDTDRVVDHPCGVQLTPEREHQCCSPQSMWRAFAR
mgnify:CR=1 FL=1